MTHNHSHTHNTENYSRAFIIGIALNFIYILIEVVYGVMINSMALIADAGHNFSDVLGLLLAGELLIWLKVLQQKKELTVSENQQYLLHCSMQYYY